ncbi:MAG: restriction endonuclease subunit M/S [Nitrosomonas sp.]|uniref:N-6 DNA methylase n=1 Tax=Nitrosomonas sp. TaxID=42353 RepID=UPI0032EF6130
MLDSETKRRIDSCRNMLVGRVPNPQSQVEQITIALIYKFMDDMDAEAEALGGKRSFFTGEFEQYGWSKLMAPGIGGFDMLNLYSEAIQKMNENPGVPALFRDIFKNAYLPHRDPETLRSFLKEINSFTYDHSERLGDAFEYLLSVLGSQGDAGQFRTPRHIIDFMVEIIDPKKDESILDPACGTAGFLISSYKHILKHNSKGYQEQQDLETYDEQGVPLELLTLDSPLHYRGDLLTPDDKKRLATNIRGYDISPDMVRLSLVNMYLHGFASPHIDEYDTLTSDEKWNELADVILANPPFMSPKGGIKPHKRFSITATRSEVLFVDYIAEHLTPNGRAAVIVPEGIIFQNGNAYKQLREMLVKQYLVAVISLPAGVFNPYSGVKTSILVLDKRLAKKTDAILFAKIENDGYHLGAQRRPVDNNDLPAAVNNIKGWLGSVQNGAAFDVEHIANLHLVAKKTISENGDYSLSGDRFRDNAKQASKHEVVPLGDVVEILDSRRKPITKGDREPGPYPYYGATGVLDYVKDYIFDEVLVLIGEDGAKWEAGEKTAYAINGKVWVNNHAHVLRPNRELLLDTYLIELINEMDLTPYITGVTVPKLNQEKLRSIKIPLPPLEVQKEIVAEIEGYQKIIDGARQVVKNYQPRISIHPDWPIVRLDEISEKITDGDHQPPPKSATGVPFITISNIEPGAGIDFSKTYFVPREYYDDLKEYRRPKRGDVLYTVTGSFGIPVLIDFDKEFCFQRHIGLIRPADKLLSNYLYFFLQSPNAIAQANAAATGVAQKTVSLESLRGFKIPLPDLDTQRAIVAQIETEQHLVNANKELIRIFEEKIKAVINRVWGETA